MVIKREADNIATQLGGIICPLAAQVVHSDLAAMEIGQKLVDSWQTVAEEACRKRHTVYAQACSRTALLKLPLSGAVGRPFRGSMATSPPSVPSAGRPMAMIRGVM